MNLIAILKRGVLITLALILTAPLHGETALDKGVICAGVTKTTGVIRRAYLVLEPTDLALTMARQVAVYRKAGAASSANLFTRRTILEPVTDPLLITSLLPLAASLGENLVTLEGMMSDLTGIPFGTGTTGEKLAAFISDSLPDPDKRKQLLILARTHPAIGFAAGLAWAETLPSASSFTYEFRDFDSILGADRGVMGRVTLNPAAPVTIPAPGAPVEVQDTSAKSNLNVSLRWFIPDTLQDLSPLLTGFDLYRVPMSAAQSRGWDATPPANAATLLIEPTARRVNSTGILPSKIFQDPAAAANIDPLMGGDAITTYLIDDNGRFLPGGAPFVDGQRFYYFAAARDLLGQAGACSPGTLITICDRLPPPVPVQLAVRSVTHFNNTTKQDVQRFELEWKMPTLPVGEAVSAYLVYRWTSASQAARKPGIDGTHDKPDENLVAMLPGTQLSFVDNGLTPAPTWANWNGGIDNGASYTPPSLPADAGKTWFYTIRAVDNSSCKNVSGNSSPIWGVLRDRGGPAGTVGTVLTPCRQLTLAWNDYSQLTENGLSAELGHARLTCQSTVARGLAWAEWEYGLQVPGQALYTWTFMGRAGFATNSAGNLRAELDRNTPGYYPFVRKFRCRVGTTAGIVSAYVESPLDPPSPLVNKRIRAQWTATFAASTLVPVSQCGGKHVVLDPATGVLLDPCGTFNPTATSTEFKVYRTVDGGPQTLVDAGFFNTSAPVVWKDDNPPVTLSDVCYYLQLLDKNSNAGPLVPQDCIECGDASLLPVPMLEDLTSAGLPGASQMRVRWFCNTAGVERFEVWVARKGGAVPLNGSGLSIDLAGHPNSLTDVSGTEGLDFSVFETAVARHVSVSGTPEFEYLLPVSAKDVYTVMVRAVGRGSYGSRVAGTFSNIENFTWVLKTLPLGNAVPWPARELPPQAEFHPGISAVHLNVSRFAGWRANAVRIGEYSDPANNAQATNSSTVLQLDTDPQVGHISTLNDPEVYLYCNDEVARAEENALDKQGYEGCIFPVVLYRVQVPSVKFPAVPGDIVQCGPMMEQIAQSESGGNTLVTDPFVLPLHKDDTGLARTLPGSDHDIMLLDRQPVIKGAKYKYLLVRFAPNKEIDRVIVTNEILVP